MPLLDYACPVCLFLLEDQIVKTDDTDKTLECPVCKKITLSPIMSVNHFQICGASYKNGYTNGK